MLTRTKAERPSKRPRAARGPAAPLSIAILDAARKICFASGPSAVTARKIAAEVGCTAPALYRHYQGIGHVLHALRMEGHVRLAVYLRRPPTSLPSNERLLAMQDAYFRFGKRHPRYFGMMFPAQLPGDAAMSFGEEEAATLLIVRDEAVRGMQRREIRGDLDATVVANHCWLSVHSLTATAVSGHLAATAPGLEKTLLAQVKAATAAWLQP